jgi:hypothetical protein
LSPPALSEQCMKPMPPARMLRVPGPVETTAVRGRARHTERRMPSRSRPGLRRVRRLVQRGPHRSQDANRGRDVRQSRVVAETGTPARLAVSSTRSVGVKTDEVRL